MPGFPPGTEPIKKTDQLAQSKNALKLALKKEYTGDRLIKAVEKYRGAQISFLKAKMHVAREKNLQNKQTNLKIDKLEVEIKLWGTKSIDDLIIESKK